MNSPCVIFLVRISVFMLGGMAAWVNWTEFAEADFNMSNMNEVQHLFASWMNAMIFSAAWVASVLPNLTHLRFMKVMILGGWAHLFLRMIFR
jgi:hypothetical protein